MARAKKTAAVVGILLVVLGAILWTGSSGMFAQSDSDITGLKDRERKDLGVLQDAFRGQNIAVFFINGTSPPMEGQIKGVTDLFGKRFLRLETVSGNVRLALIDQIVAIRQKDK